MLETDLAYMAGILDGEGCLYISKGNRVREDHTSIAYQAKLYVVSTDHELIDWLVEKFGGLTYTRRPSKAHWRVKHEWCSHAKSAVEILRSVYPYLVIKKPHADVLFRFNATVGAQRQEGRIAPLTDEVRRIREDCFQAIRALNARNKPPI